MATTADQASVRVQGRYRDAYSVAESIIGWGVLLKVLGIVGAIAIAVFGLVAGANFGMGAIVASFIVAASVGATLYALGVTVAAQGQIIRAVLDTAVNTSPLLSTEEKRDVIVASGGQASVTVPPKGEWLTCHLRVRTNTKNSPQRWRVASECIRTK